MEKTARAEDFRNRYVVYYYGAQGSGLSKLEDTLFQEAKKKPGHRVLELDFSDGEMSQKAALEELKRQLKGEKINFWRTGVVMRKLGDDNWNKVPRGLWCGSRIAAGAGVVIINALAAKGIHRFSDVLLLTSAMNMFLGIFSFNLFAQLCQWGFLRLKNRWDEKHLEKEYPDVNFGDKRSKDDERRWRELLPELFAKDVNERLKKQGGAVLCVFIDSYDAHESGRGRWLGGEHGLCRHLERAIFAIFGHEELPWEGNFWKRKDANDADGEEPHGVLDCREIDKLSPEECKQFLERLGVHGEVWKDLYKHTDGWPELLDKWCNEYGKRSEEEKCALTEEERRSMKGWVKEFFEVHWGIELSAAVADAVYLMADMQRWTKKLLQYAATAANVTLGNKVEDVVDELQDKRLIVADDGASLRMEKIRNILQHNTGLQPEQREAAYRALVDMNKVKGAEAASEEANETAYETALEAAYYMGQGGGLWEPNLGVQLQKQADKMVKQADKLKDAAEPAEELTNLEKRMRKKQQEERQRKQQKKRRMLRERAQELYIKAVEVYIAKLEPEGTDLASKDAARWPKDMTTLIAMNKLAINCNCLGRSKEALKLTERVSAACEGRPELQKTADTAQDTWEFAKENMGKAAERSPSRESEQAIGAMGKP